MCRPGVRDLDRTLIAHRFDFLNSFAIAYVCNRTLLYRYCDRPRPLGEAQVWRVRPLLPAFPSCAGSLELGS